MVLTNPAAPSVQEGFAPSDTEYSSLVRTDRVSGRIYREPEIFAEEMERIFYRGWVFLAHETEIPNPGDYKTARIGRQPVILNRTSTGDIHVMLNRCRHRGISVCDERLGNAKRFECPYHAWVYDENGRLVAVPFRTGYPKEFGVEQLGLIHVPVVDSYNGFIFASFSEDVPSLIEHLGNSRPYLDEFARRGGAGLQVMPTYYQNVFPGNWKLQMENSVDFYHVGFVHRVYRDIMDDRGTPITSGRKAGHRSRDLGHGHVALYTGPRDGDTTDDPDFNVLIFPNLVILGIHMRVVTPISVNQTLVEAVPTAPLGASEAELTRAIRRHEDFFGPAGFGTPDDMEVVMRRAPIGLEADRGDDWVYFARGLDRETVLPNGVIEGDPTDETAHRGFYRRWREMMRG